MFDKVVAGFWSTFGCAWVVAWLSSLRGQNVHDVNFVGPVIGVAAVLVLIISGVMVIANRRRAKFVQMPLIVIIFLVSADLSLFHLWRGHRGAELWISLCTAGASFLTLG